MTTPTPEALRALVQNWKRHADCLCRPDSDGDTPTEGDYGAAHGLYACADELDAALAHGQEAGRETPVASITLPQAVALVEYFGGANTTVDLYDLPEGRIQDDDGSPLPAGLYAVCAECPEEGATYLGAFDPDVDDTTPPAREGVEAVYGWTARWHIEGDDSLILLSHPEIGVVGVHKEPVEPGRPMLEAMLYDFGKLLLRDRQVGNTEGGA